MKVRRWLLEVASKMPMVVVIDAWPLLGLNNSTTGDIDPTKSYDGLHLIDYSAAIVGQRIADVLSAYFPTPRYFAAFDNSEPFSADNPRGNVITNGALDGTGGSVGSGSTGQIATSWSASRNTAFNGGTSMVSTLSKVAGAGAFLGQTWQQLVLSGTYAATATPQIDLRNATGFPVAGVGGNIVPGDKIQAMMRVEIDAGFTGLNALMTSLIMFDSSVSYESRDVFPQNPANVFPGTSTGYVGDKALFLMTEPITVPAGVQSGMVKLVAQGIPNAVLAATIRLTGVAVRKVA
jgi:hypothetical protein